MGRWGGGFSGVLRGIEHNASPGREADGLLYVNLERNVISQSQD